MPTMSNFELAFYMSFHARGIVPPLFGTFIRTAEGRLFSERMRAGQSEFLDVLTQDSNQPPLDNGMDIR